MQITVKYLHHTCFGFYVRIYDIRNKKKMFYYDYCIKGENK